MVQRSDSNGNSWEHVDYREKAMIQAMTRATILLQLKATKEQDEEINDIRLLACKRGKTVSFTCATLNTAGTRRFRSGGPVSDFPDISPGRKMLSLTPLFPARRLHTLHTMKEGLGETRFREI